MRIMSVQFDNDAYNSSVFIVLTRSKCQVMKLQKYLYTCIYIYELAQAKGGLMAFLA